MKKIITLSAILTGVIPLFVFAANDAFGILTKINQLINTAMPVLIAFAVLYFVWNVIQYTITNDEEGKKKAKSGIITGLIGLFIIVAFWGIIAVVMNTLGVGPLHINPEMIPCVPGPGVFCN